MNKYHAIRFIPVLMIFLALTAGCTVKEALTPLASAVSEARTNETDQSASSGQNGQISLDLPSTGPTGGLGGGLTGGLGSGGALSAKPVTSLEQNVYVPTLAADNEANFNLNANLLGLSDWYQPEAPGSYVYHAGIISRDLKRKNAGVGGVMQEYDRTTTRANYLILNRGIRFKGKTSDLRTFIGNVGTDGLSGAWDAINLTSAVTRYGINRYGAKACWTVELGNGELQAVCSPSDYGVVVHVPLDTLAQQMGPQFSFGAWNVTHMQTLTTASSRYCRNIVQTVDGVNPSQGGVFTEFYSQDRIARVVCL